MSRQSELAQLGRVFDTGPLSNRNKIINGAMVIDQRNGGASTSYIAAQKYVIDRCSTGATGFSTFAATCQQVSDAPAGFVYSLKTTVTTAEASGASSVFTAADFRIEGYDIADMAFGTASAKACTLSFWVKASVTGTYCVSFFNAGVTRAYLATYNISSANTWEYKTITVTGDTSGTWNTTNGIGLGMQFNVGAGSNHEGTAGAWSGTYKNVVAGSVDLNATTNATWQITGVQFEIGDTATSFEHRSIADTLQACQRYYEYSDYYHRVSYTGYNYQKYLWKVEKRATPSIATTQYENGDNSTNYGVGAQGTYGYLVNHFAGSGGGGSLGLNIFADAEL